MDKGAWRATAHGGPKELDTTQGRRIAHSTVNDNRELTERNDP